MRNICQCCLSWGDVCYSWDPYLVMILKFFMSDLVIRECCTSYRTQSAFKSKILSEKCQKLFTLFLTFLNLWCVSNVSLCEWIIHCRIHTKLILENVKNISKSTILYIFNSPSALWFWLFYWSPHNWSLINDDVWHFDSVHCLTHRI